MKIRKYRESDAEEKHDLHMNVIRDVNSDHYSEEQISAWMTFDEDNATSEEDTERWVVEDDGKIVGFGDYTPDESEITGVYVHPNHLRQGIASKLLNKIEEDAKNKGIEELSLISTITAKEFYENHGYNCVKELMYETSGEELETFRMKKEI